LAKPENRSMVLDRIGQICSSGRLCLDLHVRLYFNRFEDRWLSVWSAGPAACEVSHRWDEAISLAKRFHRVEADDAVIAALRSYAASGDTEILERARTERPECFVPLVFRLARPAEELAKTERRKQLEAIKEDLRGLARLLTALSR